MKELQTILELIGGLIASDAWVASFCFPVYLVYLAMENDPEPRT